MNNERLTEYEASNKICQEMSSNKNLVMCAGNDCMAWRWSFKDPQNQKDQAGRPVPKENWTGTCGKITRVS